MDKVRCPACRGAKKVPKLGGMIGECNTCIGEGSILASDKPKPVLAVEVDSNADIIKAVSKAVPIQADLNDAKPAESFKLDGKKAVFKKKTANR